MFCEGGGTRGKLLDNEMIVCYANLVISFVYIVLI